MIPERRAALLTQHGKARCSGTTGALGVGGNTASIVIKAKVLPAAGGTTVTVDPALAFGAGA